mgnify:CR=1 FL=1
MDMNQGELKRSIKEDPNLTEQEKGAKLSELRAPYQKMSDEELLSLVRDFVKENGREPMQKDVLYDRELKARFGPWTRMLEKAGTRPVSQRHLDKLERRREKRKRHNKVYPLSRTFLSNRQTVTVTFPADNFLFPIGCMK